MGIELNYQRLQCYEPVLTTTMLQEETLESIVPDSCPDIARIVLASGIPFVTSRSVQEGKGEFSGQVRASVLYQPEGQEGLRRLEVHIPFRSSVTGGEITDQSKMMVTPILQQIEGRALNPRKILVRANLSFGVRVWTPSQTELCCGVEAPESDGVEQLRQDAAVYYVSAVQEKPFTFSDEVSLGGRTGAEELLDEWVSFRCGESKLIGSKLIFKGEAQVHVLYRTMDGSLENGEYKLPFSQVMEMPELGEDTDCQLQLQLTGAECTLGGENGNRLFADLEILAQAVVREQRPLSLIRDVYSTVYPVQAEYLTCRLAQRSGTEEDHQNLRELVETEQPVKAVLDAKAELGLVSCVQEGDQTVVTLPVELRLIFLGEDDQVYCARRTVQTDSRFDCPLDPAAQLQCQSEGDVFGAPVSGGAEIRFALSVQMTGARRDSMAVLKDAAMQEGEPEQSAGERPSIVLRQMGADESLWDVAKSCRTTRSVILTANELEEEDQCRGRMLLIPRVRL